MDVISIITVVYNAENYLQKTFDSIRSQNSNEYELIVIDGYSKDKTIDIIKKNEDIISKWISEPDKGIYDAMNKGLSLATGKWINFLNAGDTYYSESIIQTILSCDSDKYKIIYGDSYLVDKNDSPIRLLKAGKLNKRSIKNSMVVCHQAVFIKSEITPYYNLYYKIKSDYNWLIDVVLNIQSKEIKHVKVPVINYCIEGFSQDNKKENFKEYQNIIINRFGKIQLLKNVFFDLRYFIGNFLRKKLKVHTLRFWIKG